VLVWTKAPALFRNELVAVDGLGDAVRAAEPGEVKRLGSDPVIVALAAEGGARVEVAAPVDSRERALGPVVAPAPPPSEEVRGPPAAATERDDPRLRQVVLVWVLTPISVASA
jgi:hypothetical protein